VKGAPPKAGYTEDDADGEGVPVGAALLEADDVDVAAAVRDGVAAGVPLGVVLGEAPSLPVAEPVGLFEGVGLLEGVWELVGVCEGDDGTGAHATAWYFVLGGGMACTVAPVGASVASHDSSADG